MDSFYKKAISELGDIPLNQEPVNYDPNKLYALGEFEPLEGWHIRKGSFPFLYMYYLPYKNHYYYDCDIWFELDKETTNPIQSLSSINLTKEQAKEIGIFNDKPLTIENLFGCCYASPDMLESLKIEHFNNFVSYENF